MVKKNPLLAVPLDSLWSWLMSALGIGFALAVLAGIVFLSLSFRSAYRITFDPADLDGDGDLDVLVHGMRKEGLSESVAFGGGGLWFNQLGPQGGQAGRFANRPNNLEGGWASTLADLDGDEDPDALAYGGFYLHPGLNLGEVQDRRGGKFLEQPRINPPEAYDKIWQWGSLLTGDLDGDGRTDALVLGCCVYSFIEQDGERLPNVTWLWLNRKFAALDVQGPVAPVEALYDVPVQQAALGDLDGDGDLDLYVVVAAKGPRPSERVLLNDGTGVFSPAEQRLRPDGAIALALGDLDGDGDLDALVGHHRGARVRINQGGAQEGQPGRFANGASGILGSRTRTVRLADFDGDGDLDALMGGAQGAEVWLNDGQARFSRTGQRFPLNERQDLTTGDFNNDGLPDVFVAGYDKDAWVYLNDGQGGFRASVHSVAPDWNAVPKSMR